jgi:hypothetical protein
MITKGTATRMLDEFQQEVERVGYEAADKRCLNNIFGYLKIRCADFRIYDNDKKLKAVLKLEAQWQQDRIGKPILADHGDGILGYDPSGTQRGALTIGAIIRELRALLVELPERIQKPAPILLPPLVALGVSPASITETVDAAVARALEARDVQRRETVSA